MKAFEAANRAGDFLVLDTETTDLYNQEICLVAIINGQEQR